MWGSYGSGVLLQILKDVPVSGGTGVVSGVARSRCWGRSGSTLPSLHASDPTPTPDRSWTRPLVLTRGTARVRGPPLDPGDGKVCTGAVKARERSLSGFPGPPDPP